MKKMFLAAALVASVCVPVYANQYENSGESVFDAPVFDEDIIANLAKIIMDESGRKEPITIPEFAAEIKKIWCIGK